VKPPLLIISLPRSGSSMTADIVRRHGFWTGTCNLYEPRQGKCDIAGYIEPIRIQEFIQKHFKNDYDSGLLLKPSVYFRTGIIQIIKRDGHRVGQNWLLKMGAYTYPAFKVAFPGLTCISLYRGIDAIRKSRPKERTELFINNSLAIMDLAVAIGGHRVDYDLLIDGNYTQLEAPLAEQGVTFDPGIAKEIIRPELRHCK